MFRILTGLDGDDQRAEIRRLESALDNLSQGVSMFDRAGRLIICNQRFIEIYDLPPTIIRPGCTFRDILAHHIEVGLLGGDPKHYDADAIAAAALKSPGTRLFDLSDGRIIAAVSRPTADGGWLATHEDVTERRRAASELARTRSFLDMVIENVPVTIVVKDAREHRYLLINKAGEELFGYSRDEMIGRSAHELYSKEQADHIVAGDEELLRTGNRLFESEHAMKTPRTDVRLVTTRRMAIAGDDGRPQYIVGVIEDVTERKRAEERIAHLALHDTLTDLPNRAAFNERMAATL